MRKQNRRQHLKELATPAGMKRAALLQRQRRGGLDHVYVIGGLRMLEGLVVLKAIQCDAAWSITRPLTLTASPTNWNRWRTRQAASQFIQRHGLADVHVFNLDWLDVVAEPAVDPLTARQLAGGPPATLTEEQPARSHVDALPTQEPDEQCPLPVLR